MGVPAGWVPPEAGHSGLTSIHPRLPSLVSELLLFLSLDGHLVWTWAVSDRILLTGQTYRTKQRADKERRPTRLVCVLSHVVSCRVVSSRAVSSFVLCCVVLCCVVLCCVVSCPVVLCYACRSTRVVSYCVVSCRVISYRIVLSYRVTSCMSYRVVFCHALSYRVVWCHIVSCGVVSSRVVLCHVMLCRVVVWCRVISCRVVLCRVVPLLPSSTGALTYHCGSEYPPICPRVLVWAVWRLQYHGVHFQSLMTHSFLTPRITDHNRQISFHFYVTAPQHQTLCMKYLCNQYYWNKCS